MVLGLVLALAVGAAEDPCVGKGTALYVSTSRRTLWLCEDGSSKEAVRVALGQGGIGKRVEGDAKVPLGEYPLSAAIPSADFHLFLPVGYPTPQQRRTGYTGNAIGVHGPLRGYSGPATTSRDWTLGCIAVGTDDEIDRIAEWVKAKRVRRIIIEAR